MKVEKKLDDVITKTGREVSTIAEIILATAAGITVGSLLMAVIQKNKSK